MNKYVYPLNLWNYLPQQIKFTEKIVSIQFTNGSFYILFKQPQTSMVEDRSHHNSEIELDWYSHEKMENFKDLQYMNFKHDMELKQKFNGR
jgi:hypothetical protein